MSDEVEREEAASRLTEEQAQDALLSWTEKRDQNLLVVAFSYFEQDPDVAASFELYAPPGIYQNGDLLHTGDVRLGPVGRGVGERPMAVLSRRANDEGPAKLTQERAEDVLLAWTERDGSSWRITAFSFHEHDPEVAASFTAFSGSLMTSGTVLHSGDVRTGMVGRALGARLPTVLSR